MVSGSHCLSQFWRRTWRKLLAFSFELDRQSRRDAIRIAPRILSTKNTPFGEREIISEQFSNKRPSHTWTVLRPTLSKPEFYFYMKTPEISSCSMHAWSFICPVQNTQGNYLWPIRSCPSGTRQSNLWHCSRLEWLLKREKISVHQQMEKKPAGGEMILPHKNAFRSSRSVLPTDNRNSLHVGLPCHDPWPSTHPRPLQPFLSLFGWTIQMGKIQSTLFNFSGEQVAQSRAKLWNSGYFGCVWECLPSREQVARWWLTGWRSVTSSSVAKVGDVPCHKEAEAQDAFLAFIAKLRSFPTVKQHVSESWPICSMKEHEVPLSTSLMYAL